MRKELKGDFKKDSQGSGHVEWTGGDKPGLVEWRHEDRPADNVSRIHTVAGTAKVSQESPLQVCCLGSTKASRTKEFRRSQPSRYL